MVAKVGSCFRSGEASGSEDPKQAPSLNETPPVPFQPHWHAPSCPLAAGAPPAVLPPSTRAQDARAWIDFPARPKCPGDPAKPKGAHGTHGRDPKVHRMPTSPRRGAVTRTRSHRAHGCNAQGILCGGPGAALAHRTSLGGPNLPVPAMTTYVATVSRSQHRKSPRSPSRFPIVGSACDSVIGGVQRSPAGPARQPTNTNTAIAPAVKYID